MVQSTGFAGEGRNSFAVEIPCSAKKTPSKFTRGSFFFGTTVPTTSRRLGKISSFRVPNSDFDLLFVVGTNLVGPMGLDLIPVKGRKAAENLKQDYKGEVIVTLDKITPELIEKARRGRLKN